MSAQSNGWPGEYGVPLNQDAIGWHVLTFPNGHIGYFPWDGENTHTWWIVDREARADQLPPGIRYCGLARTPAQFAAAEGAAALAMRDQCVAACEAERNEQQEASHGDGISPTAHVLAAAGAELCRTAIHTLPIPAPGALERVVADAVTQALEALLAQQPSLTALRHAIDAAEEIPAIDGRRPTSVIAPIIWRAMLTQAIGARREEAPS